MPSIKLDWQGREFPIRIKAGFGCTALEPSATENGRIFHAKTTFDLTVARSSNHSLRSAI
jgi:hypothetical protein